MPTKKRSKHLDGKQMKKNCMKEYKKHPSFKRNQQSQVPLSQSLNAYTIWINWDRTATNKWQMYYLKISNYGLLKIQGSHKWNG